MLIFYFILTMMRAGLVGILAYFLCEYIWDKESFDDRADFSAAAVRSLRLLILMMLICLNWPHIVSKYHRIQPARHGGFKVGIAPVITPVVRIWVR